MRASSISRPDLVNTELVTELSQRGVVEHLVEALGGSDVLFDIARGMQGEDAEPYTRH